MAGIVREAEGFRSFRICLHTVMDMKSVRTHCDRTPIMKTKYNKRDNEEMLTLKPMQQMHWRMYRKEEWMIIECDQNHVISGDADASQSGSPVCRQLLGSREQIPRDSQDQLWEQLIEHFFRKLIQKIQKHRLHRLHSLHICVWIYSLCLGDTYCRSWRCLESPELSSCHMHCLQLFSVEVTPNPV